MAAGFQDADHLPEGLMVGLDVDGIAVPTQAEMFQGAEGKNQVERSIRKIKLLGVPGEDRFLGRQGAPVAHIHRRNRGMGQQTQDEMPIGPEVEDGPGGGALDVLGGESALKVDKSFRMASRFKHRFGENLKGPRVLAKKGKIPFVLLLEFFRNLRFYPLLRGLGHFGFPSPYAPTLPPHRGFLIIKKDRNFCNLFSREEGGEKKSYPWASNRNMMNHPRTKGVGFMESGVLNAIPFQIDLEQLAKQLRIKEGSGHLEKLQKLAEQAQAAGKPKAAYRMAYIEERTDDGVKVKRGLS